MNQIRKRLLTLLLITTLIVPLFYVNQIDVHANLPEFWSGGTITNIRWTGNSLVFHYSYPANNGTHWVFPIDYSGIRFSCYNSSGGLIGQPRAYANQTLYFNNEGIDLSLSGSCFHPVIVGTDEWDSYIYENQGAYITGAYAATAYISVYIDFLLPGGYTTACSGPIVDQHDATCTLPAQVIRNCNTCHKDWAVNSGEPLEHDWRYVVDTDLTCEQDYTGHAHCFNPAHDTKYDGPIDKMEGTVFESAPGHHFEELVNDTPAGCTTKGTSHYQCTNIINGKRCTETNSTKGNFATADNGTFDVQPFGHYISKDLISKKPTVYDNGTRVYICEHCNEEVTNCDIQNRHFNIYIGNKRVIKVLSGDRIVWGLTEKM